MIHVEVEESCDDKRGFCKILGYNVTNCYLRLVHTYDQTIGDFRPSTLQIYRKAGQYQTDTDWKVIAKMRSAQLVMPIQIESKIVRT